MSLENVAGNPADDSGDSRLSLRDQLEQAFASAEPAPSADTPASEPSAEPVSAIEAEPKSERQSGPDVRPRGPDGKFTEKPKAEAAPAKQAAPAQPNSPAQPGQSAKRQAPQSWAAEKRAIFDTLAPDVQDYLLQRENEQIAGVQKLKGDYEGKLASVAPVVESLKQVEQRLRLNGVEPGRYVSQLIAADEFLRTKPQEAIRWIAQNYGINLDALGAQPQGQQQPYDPVAPIVQQYVAPLYEKIQAYEQAQQQAKQAQAIAAIDAFRNDPANAHFAEVEADMVERLPIYQRKNPSASYAELLKAAYEDAVYANPQTRAKVLADQQARAVEAKREQAQAQVSKAKAAAVSVTGSPGVAVSNAAVKPKSLRAELESQFAARI
ncbi:MAG: hypothetical protein INF12_14640 [Methylobacterium sp.]|nr:hypothetical protein [Methylobacterium sp.]